MKAFLVGLIFLIAVAILAGMGVLLYPLLIALIPLVAVILIIVLFLLGVWLLGKLIILIWEKIK